MQEDQAPPRRLGVLAELRRRLRERSENPGPEELWLAQSLRLVLLQRSPAELWLAMGREGDYLVVPGTFCSCPHYRYRVAWGLSSEPCYHMVAVEIARRTGRYHDLTETLTEDDVETIIHEVVAAGRSAHLRRLLHRLGGGVDRVTG